MTRNAREGSGVPDRMIRDRARRSPTLQAMSDAAERAAWRLTVAADDYGRFEADPEVLLATLFKRRPAGWPLGKMARVLDEWTSLGYVIQYAVQGRRYGYLTSWHRHQRPPRLASRYPDPPELLTIPTERTIHDAIYGELRARRVLFGLPLLAVERNVRVGNGFADIVVTTASGRAVIEVKRTRADAGAIRQVTGYRQHLKGCLGVLVIATGIGPTVGVEDFTHQDVALATYGTDWKAELTIPGGPFQEGVLDLRAHVIPREITSVPRDLRAGSFCPGDEGKEGSEGKKDRRKKDSEASASVSSRGDDAAAPAAKVLADRIGRAAWEDAAWPSAEALAALYNAGTPDECPAVEMLSPARRDKARKYLAMFPERAWWHTVCARIGESRLLRGLKPSPGHEKFLATFDWLLTKGKDGTENALKVYEGRYTD